MFSISPWMMLMQYKPTTQDCEITHFPELKSSSGLKLYPSSRPASVGSIYAHSMSDKQTSTPPLVSGQPTSSPPYHDVHCLYKISPGTPTAQLRA